MAARSCSPACVRWPDRGAQASDRRWCARFLEDAEQGLPDHGAPALRGPQDCQYAEQAAQVGAAQDQADLNESCMAETREAAHQAFERALKRFGAKHPQAMEWPRVGTNCWRSMASRQSIGCISAPPTRLSRRGRPVICHGPPEDETQLELRLPGHNLAMVFKLLQTAHQRWKRIKHFQKLELVASIVKF